MEIIGKKVRNIVNMSQIKEKNICQYKLRNMISVKNILY